MVPVPPIPATWDISRMHCGSDVMGSMWTHFFASLPSKGRSGGFPHMAQFIAVLLLLSLFEANLSQIFPSLNHITLSTGLQIALYLTTRCLPTFLSSSYPIPLLVLFIIASGLSWLPMPPVLLSGLLLAISLSWNISLSVYNVRLFILWDSAGLVTFPESLSMHIPLYTRVSYSPPSDHPLLSYYCKFENMYFFICFLFLLDFVKL